MLYQKYHKEICEYFPFFQYEPDEIVFLVINIIIEIFVIINILFN